MGRLIFSLSLIIGGLIAGYIVQQLVNRELIRLPWSLEQTRKNLQRLGLLFFMPVSFVGAIWIVRLDTIKVALLPLIGVGSLLLGGLCGLAIARLRAQTPSQTGTLFCCGSFTNIGSIGALICFIFLGEAGFALVAVYKMFEEVVYYTIGFPIARYFSGAAKDSLSFSDRLWKVISDPFVCAALTALTVGLFLNLSAVPRPQFFETINSVFVPVGTLVLLVSIGMGMRFSSVSTYAVDGLMIAAVKFVIVPLAAVSCAYFSGLGALQDGLPLKVVLVNSSMPVAFTALVAASVYDLDLNLANTCWLISTFGLLLVLPWLAFVLTLF
jgi:predicted permease